MYARVITKDEADAFERDKSERLPFNRLRSGMPCVVRISTARTNKQFGLEYGGILKDSGIGVLLETLRVHDGSRCKLPLLVGKSNELMSAPVPALPARERALDGSTKKAVSFVATPAFPSRPIGYILGEEFAASGDQGGCPGSGACHRLEGGPRYYPMQYGKVGLYGAFSCPNLLLPNKPLMMRGND